MVCEHEGDELMMIGLVGDGVSSTSSSSSMTIDG